MSDERFAGHALDLAGLMCGQFGWAPDAFWRATPAEIAAIWSSSFNAQHIAQSPPDVDDIAALMEIFPDG